MFTHEEGIISFLFHSLNKYSFRSFWEPDTVLKFAAVSKTGWGKEIPAIAVNPNGNRQQLHHFGKMM